MVVIVKGKPRVDSTLGDDVVLWRYLDMAKFIDLIHNNTLFFTRGDQFEDKFEGAFTNSIKLAIEKAYKDNNIKSSYQEFKKGLRERVFVNCWRRGTDDSMAMWRVYGRSPTSLAITSTVGKLRDALQNARIPHAIAIKEVKYVKHWRDPELQIKPYSDVFAYKVTAYDYENEVRVIIDRFGDDYLSPIKEFGMNVHLTPNSFLRSIVVSPEAPTWFFDLIDAVSKKYGMSTPIRRSKLAFKPV
ncbi:hypothetical protein [Dongia sedimenti]|uniref:DUF2971 domain-containing protein n=1 Tax=Dongia sedimenti TaxID=3064282 RepID=A0ABU0YSS0_9PROT|nr:hypothetical protein [Rhodospirillaceae bacterium R-7]